MALIGTTSEQEKSNSGLNFYIDGKDSSQTSIIQQLGTNQHNGIIEGATWSSDGGGSWYFDGTNDRVVFGGDGTTADQSNDIHYYEFQHDWNTSAHNQCVIDGWIKPMTITNGACILCKRTNNNGWPIVDLKLMNTNSFDHDTSAGNYGSSLMYSQGNDNIISTGAWIHIGWSFCAHRGSANSYDNRSLWLNGAKITTNKSNYNSDRNDLTYSNRPYVMGNLPDGVSWTGTYYHGYIAIMRVYTSNKGSSSHPYLFNENIIKQHYDSERSRFGV